MARFVSTWNIFSQIYIGDMSNKYEKFLVIIAKLDQYL